MRVVRNDLQAPPRSRNAEEEANRLRRPIEHRGGVGVGNDELRSNSVCTRGNATVKQTVPSINAMLDGGIVAGESMAGSIRGTARLRSPRMTAYRRVVERKGPSRSECGADCRSTTLTSARISALSQALNDNCKLHACRVALSLKPGRAIDSDADGRLVAIIT